MVRDRQTGSVCVCVCLCVFVCDDSFVLLCVDCWTHTTVVSPLFSSRVQSGAWSKGANKAVASAPPPGAMQTPAGHGGGAGRSGRGGGAGGGGGGGGGRSSHFHRDNNSNGGGGGGGGGRGRGRGAGGGRHNHNNNSNNNNNNTNNNSNPNSHRNNHKGRGGGRGGDNHHANGHAGGPHPDRITIKDVQLLEATGMGQTPQQKSVIRIDAREFIRQRLQYVEPCQDFQPHPQCRWTDENRMAEIQALCSRVMELGDVSKGGNQANKKQPKHDTAPLLEDCKPLQVNEEKRWKSKAMERKSTLIDQSSPLPETTEEIVGKALLILNKVSWTTLDRLTEQFVETTNLVQNEEVRKAIIQLMVSKAQLEPHFGPMYAQICAIIAKQVKTFKKELLEQCQKEFDVDVAHKIENATKGITDTDEIEYHTNLIRKAYIGHMTFLGELYLRDVVKLAIMMYCLDELLKDEEHEESLECFAHLMSTMGEKLDGHAKQNKKDFDWQKVVELRNSTKISNRIKFLLQDLMELRERGKTLVAGCLFPLSTCLRNEVFAEQWPDCFRYFAFLFLLILVLASPRFVSSFRLGQEAKRRKGQDDCRHS